MGVNIEVWIVTSDEATINAVHKDVMALLDAGGLDYLEPGRDIRVHGTHSYVWDDKYGWDWGDMRLSMSRPVRDEPRFAVVLHCMSRLFAPSYRRGRWPSMKPELLALREIAERHGATLHAGGDNMYGCPYKVGDEWFAERDEAWAEMQEVE